MKKFLIFILGVIIGAVLMYFGIDYLPFEKKGPKEKIEYFDNPISYENKKSTSFKVFQVTPYGALANEISNTTYKYYSGTTVLIKNGKFYNDQVIDVKNPIQVGTFSYQTKENQVLGTTVGGDYITVPIIDLEK